MSNQEPSEPDELRRRAEKSLADRQEEVPPTVSETDALALLHELHVSKIELEAQNEELRVARDELEARTRELAESEQRYRDLVDRSPSAIIVIADDRIVFANQAAIRLLGGHTENNVVGKSCHSFVPARDVDVSNQRLARVVEGHTVPWMERELVRLDGKTVYVQSTSQPITYNGRPASLTIALDVTERKEAEARERELEAHKREFYQRTILAATDGKLVIEERDAIRAMAGSSLADWAVDTAGGLARIRDDAVALAGSLGMDQLGILRLATCIGEATSNALRHAGGGKASLHRLQDSLLFEVEDHGPGIGTLSIPHVALSPGYSTAGTLGMGYKLMILSASKVYLATGPDGTTVACEIGLRNDEPGDRPEVI